MAERHQHIEAIELNNTETHRCGSIAQMGVSPMRGCPALAQAWKAAPVEQRTQRKQELFISRQCTDPDLAPAVASGHNAIAPPSPLGCVWEGLSACHHSTRLGSPRLFTPYHCLLGITQACLYPAHACFPHSLGTFPKSLTCIGLVTQALFLEVAA